MAASDAAFVDAQNQSRRGRLNEEAAVKQEERQGTLDERQDTLFNRSTTLFEQQQKLFGDEQAQKKLAKKMNTAAAMWRGSGGSGQLPNTGNLGCNASGAGAEWAQSLPNRLWHMHHLAKHFPGCSKQGSIALH